MLLQQPLALSRGPLSLTDLTDQEQVPQCTLRLALHLRLPLAHAGPLTVWDDRRCSQLAARSLETLHALKPSQIIVELWVAHCVPQVWYAQQPLCKELYPNSMPGMPECASTLPHVVWVQRRPSAVP